MFRIVKFLITAVLITIAVGVIYFSLKPEVKKTIEVTKSRVNDIETMAQLSVVDIYSEVPVLDTINNKVLFGVQKQTGSVSFDLEKIKVDTVGDTVRIVLPPEIVEIYESTEDNSWEVIDTKNIGILGVLRSDKLTDREENRIKANIKKNSKKRLYRTGVIRRARSEGSRNLEELMQNVYKKPVKVTDPTPNGAYYEKYR